MRFEQISNTPTEPSKEQPPYHGWILENGIWRKPSEEKNIESIEQNEKDSDTKGKEAEKELKSIEEELEKLSNKEYLGPEDVQKKKKLEIEYTTLDKQAKELPKEEKKELLKEIKEKMAKEKMPSEEKIKEEPKKERKKLNPWENYKKHVETLSDDFWLGLDDIMNIFLGKDPEDLDYLKLHKSKLSRETPVWIEEETKEKQKEPKEEKGGKEKVPPEEKNKEQLKEKDASSVMEKILQNPEALSKIFHEAFEISEDADVQERWHELKTAISKVIEKKGGFEKEEEKIPDAVTKATEFINGEEKKDKKESPWGTVFGTIGWSILLFLVFFMLLELKGNDYLSGQATGKKKEKK